MPNSAADIHCETTKACDSKSAIATIVCEAALHATPRLIFVEMCVADSAAGTQIWDNTDVAEIVIAAVNADAIDDELVAAWVRLMPQLSTTAAAPDRAALAAIVASPGSLLLVAREGTGGPIVGAACLTLYRIPTALHARIDDVVVDEAARGRGIGEALTRAAIEHARVAGARAVGLTSHPRREAANRLYRRLGFELRETNTYGLTLAEPAPDTTAVRVALWRALHVEVDPPPHVLADELGVRIAEPPPDWRARGDMHPDALRRIRTSIVARARFVEDLVVERSAAGAGRVSQYVLLGAGLDTFAQRRPDLAAQLRIFEVDQPGPQAWKRRRLAALGLAQPASLHFVPVDFERMSWWDELVHAGFDPRRPAVIASTGVSMYLTREANVATLRQVAAAAPGTTLAMTFLLPVDLVDAIDRPMFEMAIRGARSSGTPFVSFFPPDDILAMATAAGFSDVRHVASSDLARRYFASRPDDLVPGTDEDFLVATV
jgi:methyltransferase (TIGR00027 family)